MHQNRQDQNSRLDTSSTAEVLIMLKSSMTTNQEFPVNCFVNHTYAKALLHMSHHDITITMDARKVIIHDGNVRCCKQRNANTNITYTT